MQVLLVLNRQTALFLPSIASHLGLDFAGREETSHLNKRPTILLARLLATPDPPKALFAMLEAWLNLSQREKAIVFVIVRTSAMAAAVYSQYLGMQGNR